MTIKDKMKRLTDVLTTIEKQFGQGAIMRLGSAPAGVEAATFPSGSFGLDGALGIGGYPLGRIVEIYGPESSGKTTLTLHAIAEVQRTGGVCAFIDAEHALDVTYAKALGVNVDELLVAQPDYGEQALEITEKLVSSGSVSLVVIDSVAALTPKAELVGEMGDQHVGLQARMMSQAMRKLTAAAYQTGCTITFINQIRHKIGVKFGSPETTTGGNALKFYASVRLDVRRIGKVLGKDADEQIGNKVRVKVVKNKLAPPFRAAEFEIRFGQGILRAAEVLDCAVERNIVQKSGAYFSLDGDRIGHGREKVLTALQEHPEMIDQLVRRLTEDGAGTKTNAAGKDKANKAA